VRRVKRTARLALLVALVVLASAAVAAPAQAAKRKVPFGFYGATLIAELVSPQQISDAALDQQMALMASSGVESLRVTLGWDALEPTQGTYRWTILDRLVATAARHRITILANVTASSHWASSHPASPDYWRYPPKDPKAYGQLMRQAALRYGPKGSLWAENPGVPRVPIRQWQVWNEQMAPWYWVPRPWAPTYVKVLKAAYKAIHRVDRKAKVIAGSLMSYGNYHQWDGVRDLYRNGAKKYFDLVAVHPFTNDKSVRVVANHTLEIIRQVRQVMRRHGDKRKPIAVTEMTWLAAQGKVPGGSIYGMETTAKGQALRLKAAYGKLAREHRKMHISGAYWFTWASDYIAEGEPTSMSYRFAGLVQVTARNVFQPLPILGTFSRSAAKYEGCRKSTNARRCR
jgi:polysaccharide biosynthesis protein PslG